MDEIVNSKEIVPSSKMSTADLPYEGYDVYLTPDKKEYKLVIFKYHPEAEVVVIEKIQKMDRGLALNFENRKSALKQLIKRK